MTGQKALAGRIALVTGGTQGCGEAIAREFAAQGAEGLVICGRNAERGEAVRVALEASGARAIFVPADLENLEDLRRVIAACDAAFGRIDVLVNAAGLTDRGDIFDTTPERYDEIFAVNVRAPFFLMQGAARIMAREKTHGCMINIQSMSAHGGQAFIAAYCASKGALATLTKNTANALLKHRIRVLGLNIGWMNTPGEDRIMRAYHGAQDGWLAAAEAGRPFGRLVDPREVARMAAYLASDAAGLITGANIDMDQMVAGTSDPPLEPGAWKG